MNQTDPRVAFIEARLAEDEQEAQQGYLLVPTLQDVSRPKSEWPRVPGAHPDQRMLHEIETKRRMLAEMIPILNDLDEIASSQGLAPSDPRRPGEYLREDSDPVAYLLMLLAQSWFGHDDYAALFPGSVHA
ncbi:hypothetical protein DQ384_05325 [Sphaerisporangium album]|uniref:Uncharacterized protein n=1 Tax=Sphaerisporangium album TaxID=509200 RepID=A0A367FNZ9_9ACTN|nr:DUF6221 family protein [Sphaerisporangium album]RCG31964.1 hypothetical protein DQ384_05325 [Sphaerisporangium album]